MWAVWNGRLCSCPSLQFTGQSIKRLAYQFVFKTWPYQNCFFYSSLVALLNLFFELETNQRHVVHIAVLADYWKLGRFPAAKPAPQHCDSLGWWGMHAKPVPWICLRTLEKMEKKQKVVTYTFLLRQKLKITLSKTRIRMLRSSVGAILAKQYHHRVSSPLLCVLLHPSVEPKHIIGYTLRTLPKPHTT